MFPSYGCTHGILGPPRMEVPSRCPQVSLMLTQMNPGLSPAQPEERPWGQQAQRSFCSMPACWKGPSWHPWQSEPIGQCRCKCAVGKKPESLFVLLFLPEDQWKTWGKIWYTWILKLGQKRNPISAANLYSWLFSCSSSMQLFTLTLYLKIQKKMKHLNVPRSGTR